MGPPAQLPDLPPAIDLETPRVLKALAAASRSLAELKGRAAAIPNQGILIDTLALQEAKASSEIENIVTTQDELFRASLYPETSYVPAVREVARYRKTLRLGYERLQKTQGLITNNLLIDLCRRLLARGDGFRTIPGTVLMNEATGETVHVPPQDGNEVIARMTALERFINEDESCRLDPLIKMALIHYQFESIHPFHDGNGRVGRILNLLYLTRAGLLDIPILYHSRYIIRTRADYYRLLRAVRDHGAWEDWVLYMLEAVTETAAATLRIVEEMRGQMAYMKQRLRDELPKLYSQDLLNSLFLHPYTRIDFIKRDLKVTRPTAAKYLNTLAEHGFVEKRRAGRNNYYVNVELVKLFLIESGDDQ
ncbi:MAG: Adenosine monophosphate-protein transferase SoFic [Verrucomicrobia subdivision 3 bacterium]|nr:Adenosine monophosphate-protein transferase SoFic [Limisphaerales bacterium]